MVSHRPVAALATLIVASLLASPAAADSPADIGLRFSLVEETDTIQPGCTAYDVEDNPCHQIATMMNGLDSPKIDVLILVPASPFAERDSRIMRQSVQMWADGLTWLAADMGLQWMADGVEFHIAVEMIDATGGEAHFTTYPIWDPEVVVIATNPVGGIGIGIDPIDFAGQIFGEGDGQGPCHGVKNPFDLALWENLPGYNSHHGGRSGTYTEDCDGGGGNVCFAVNGAIDPATDVIDIFQLYDLVSHEVGHCLTLGHVGDGAEGSWSSVPTNDIMAYNSDPPGKSKCVSTLNVEGFAVAMSRYLDLNLDGVVDSDDYLFANDAEGNGGRPFQIQHPDNHYYASPTRQAIDCPQPDMGPVPLGEVKNFTPQAPPRSWISIQSKAQLPLLPVPQGLLHLEGAVNGTAGTVVLSVQGVPDADLDDDAPQDPAELDLGIANVTAVLQDGRWTGDVDLSALAVGDNAVVAVHLLDAQGMLVDSDRVNVTVGPRLAAADEASGVDAPGFPVALVVMALAAVVAVLRRK
jgi:hypothetical protein